MLCCGVLCGTVLYADELCCIALLCTVLFWVVLWRVASCCVVFYRVYCLVLFCVRLHRGVRYSALLR